MIKFLYALTLASALASPAFAQSKFIDTAPPAFAPVVPPAKSADPNAQTPSIDPDRLAKPRRTDDKAKSKQCYVQADALTLKGQPREDYHRECMED